MRPHIVDIINAGTKYPLPSDLLTPALMADVADLLLADIDFDEVWPDGEVIVDSLVRRGSWVFAERANLAFSGGVQGDPDRTKEPAPRKTIYAFHSAAEARLVGALAIARHRHNRQVEEARSSNPHWPLMGNSTA